MKNTRKPVAAAGSKPPERSAAPKPAAPPRAAQVRKRQDLFLDAFTKTGTILGACRRVGISRETVRQWRLNDPKFEARFQDSDLDITETLETKAMSQAMGGDTTLIIFLLKSRRPNVYRDHFKVEHAGGITVKDLCLEAPEK